MNETSELRWDYGDPDLGTCKETINGGNHFRYWIQDGPSGNRCVDASVVLMTSPKLRPGLLQRRVLLGHILRNANSGYENSFPSLVVSVIEVWMRA